MHKLLINKDYSRARAKWQGSSKQLAQVETHCMRLVFRLLAYNRVGT